MENKNNKVTFCDCISGRLFESDFYTLERNFSNFNQLRWKRQMENIDLNTWYEQLGLPNIYEGDIRRWPAWLDCGNLIMTFTWELDRELDKPICYIDYNEWPRLNLDKYIDLYYYLHEEESQ